MPATSLLRRACLLSLLLASGAASSLSLQGSNTIGARLAPACALSYLEHHGFTDLTTHPGAVENEQQVCGRQPGGERIIDIAAHGSGTAFSGLLAGSADIGMASRPIKVSEKKALAAAGDMQSATAEHTIAMDGLAVLVHRDNPIDHLTIEQIAAIFSGEIENWNKVGGDDAPIRLYARDDKSGTWDTFAGLVLGKRKLHPDAMRFESNDQLSDTVANDPHGIGFSGLASVHQAKALAVADGAARAIRPTRLSVATEDYPLARRLYLYTRPDRFEGDVAALIEHCQSEIGQNIVEQVGFVSQNIIELDPEPLANAPAAYQQLSTSARRLSVNFRFRQGSAELDNKALRDLRRLAEFMAQPEQQGSRIHLVGFNDSDSSENWGELISRFRALAVQAELMKAFIPVHQMLGLGAFLPVAAAGNNNASVKNGRVEVWLSRGPMTASDSLTAGNAGGATP